MAQYLIKHIVEDLRSCLDWIATTISHNLRGERGGERTPYYPICKSVEDFNKAMARDFRGLDVAAPGVQQVLTESQPYNPGRDSLAKLVKLSNENKHSAFSKQSLRKSEERQIFFGGMGLFGLGPAGLTLGAAPAPDLPSGNSVIFQSDDGLTLMAITPVNDWQFIAHDLPVIGTLRSIIEQVSAIVGQLDPLL